MVQGTLDPSNNGGPLPQRKYNKERDRENLVKMVYVCYLLYSFPSRPGFIKYIQQIIVLLLEVLQKILLNMMFLYIKVNIVNIFVVCSHIRL